MKKNIILMVLMSLPFVSFGNPIIPAGSNCTEEFQAHGTSINGVDTRQWVTINGVLPSEDQLDNLSSRMGLGCNAEVNVGTDASSGDYAYIYDEFEVDDSANSLGEDSLRYQFDLNLSGLVNSYNDGNGLVIFQVRTENEVETRFLNVSLFRYTEPTDYGYIDGWELKLVWFTPNYASDGGSHFIRQAEWVDIGPQSEGSVHVEFEWTPYSSEIRINNETYQNPLHTYGLVNLRPFHTRLGYLYTSTPLKGGDILRFESVLPEN